MKVLERKTYADRAYRLMAQFPILAILGPRQCGKTTFAKRHFADFEYLDLERPSDRFKLENNAELFLTSRSKPLIIDEAQRCPELFPVLRSMVDSKRRTLGQYILLGSASFTLQKDLSESLSGRIAFLDLSPFLIGELPPPISIDHHWLKGGFPDALLTKTEEIHFDWFENYTRTLIERDLPSLGIDITAHQFRNLWAMCAHFHANILNMNKIAASLGLSPHTVARYIDILEQIFVLRRLPPFYANIKKRLVKAPKLYFRDSGIFHYFSRMISYDDLMTSPYRGDSFEGYAVEQCIHSFQTKRFSWESYYFRSNDGLEIDLLMVQGKKIIPIEIKCKLTPTPEDLANLHKLQSFIHYERGFVVTLGDNRYPVSDRIECLGIEQLRKKSAWGRAFPKQLPRSSTGSVSKIKSRPNSR